MDTDIIILIVIPSIIATISAILVCYLSKGFNSALIILSMCPGLAIAMLLILTGWLICYFYSIIFCGRNIISSSDIIEKNSDIIGTKTTIKKHKTLNTNSDVTRWDLLDL